MFESDMIALITSLTTQRTEEIVINNRIVRLCLPQKRQLCSGELGSLEGLMPWRKGKTKAGMKNTNQKSKGAEAVEKT